MDPAGAAGSKGKELIRFKDCHTEMILHLMQGSYRTGFQNCIKSFPMCSYMYTVLSKELDLKDG